MQYAVEIVEYSQVLWPTPLQALFRSILTK